jgi:hypothetical protein
VCELRTAPLEQELSPNSILKVLPTLFKNFNRPYQKRAKKVRNRNKKGWKWDEYRVPCSRVRNRGLIGESDLGNILILFYLILLCLISSSFAVVSSSQRSTVEGSVEGSADVRRQTTDDRRQRSIGAKEQRSTGTVEHTYPPYTHTPHKQVTMKSAVPHFIAAMKQSSTLTINTLAKEMEKEGTKVYRLGFGQSPFPIPPLLVESLKRHAHRGEYTPVNGILPLRQAIARKYSIRYGTTVCIRDPESTPIDLSYLLYYCLLMLFFYYLTVF